MRGGDISNETPGRIVVVLDLILERKDVTEKVLGIFTKQSTEINYNRAFLSKLWHFSGKIGVALELVSYEYTQSQMDEVLEDLNNLGTNPFAYAKAYSDISVLVAEMPYRPELLGVVDTPERALRYGSKYIDIGRVF